MVDFKYDIKNELKEFLEGCKCEEISIGCSDTQVIKVEKNQEEYFLKIGDKKVLHNEFIKLDFLQSKLPVPNVILHDINNSIEYIVTSKIPGEMVCSDYYMEHQSEGIDIIVSAFKMLYDVNIDNCPIDVSLDYKLKLAEENISNGLILEENVSQEALDRFGSAEGILKYLKKNKFKEDLCFSHGDISLPNIFAYNKEFSGFIDVGDCGVADKWFDIAIVIRSIIRNFGKEYVSEFLNKLNVEYDEFKYDYYMLLMQLYL